MKLHYIKLILGFLFFVIQPLYAIQKNKIVYVRVLLDENKIDDNNDVQIFSPAGIFVVDKNNKNRKKIHSPLEQFTICYKKKSLYINGCCMQSNELMLVPLCGYISYNNQRYQGSCIIHVDKKKLLVINKLNIEDYVFSVLKTESWPGWPLEVNKLFAVVSRTYVLSMICNAKKTKPYHVKNTNLHQTYSGFHDHPLLKRAVETTRGLILTYNKRPIVAMFDGCCGGVIPAHMEGINFTQEPYLARPYACTFCKNNKIFSWNAQFQWNDIVKKLHKYIPKGQIVRDFRIIKKDKAGIVQEVLLQTSKNKTILTGQQMYSLFKDIKSFCFDIKRQGNIISFSGRGYGHHLGLCQWGARNMVKEGWDFKRIAAFYYPGTTCMKLL